MALHFNEDASFVPLPTKVPNLTELAYTLGFGKFCNRPYYELADSTHIWRRQYRCDDGTLGHALIDWKSAPVRENLRIMTLRYLDDAGYGQRWWPQSTDAKDPNWQYNKDHDRILETMMMFFWKQNDNQFRNAFYLQQKKVKVPKVGGEASMSHESGSPVPNTPGQHTFYLQPTRVTINDHTVHARQAGTPEIDETRKNSQVQPPPNSKTPERQRIHEPPAALSHPSSLTNLQRGADPSIQEEHSNAQIASTESPTAAEDIIHSRDYDVRPKIDPSRVVLKYRKLTDKSQLEAEGFGTIVSPSSQPQSETLSTPDLPPLTELFMLPEPQAIDLEDVQGQQDQKGAKGDEALEEDQMEYAVDDRPGSALRPDRGDEIPVDDRADQIIHSNRDDLGANDCHLDNALNRDPGDRSLNELRSSVFEEHEESFNLVRRSSRAKKPRIIIPDNLLSDDQDSEDEDQGVVTESSEPSPKRRKESKKTKQTPYTMIPKASSTSKNTRRGRKKKLTSDKTAKKVEDRIQTTDLTDPPLSHSVSETDKNSYPCSAQVRASPTPNNSQGESHSEEAVEKNLREPKRRLNVSFVIIQRRNALTVKKQIWPEGKLRGQSVGFLFDAVSSLCQRTNIEQITCTLCTSRTEFLAKLQRGDNESFLSMERNFTKEISKAISMNANDGKEIEICIEPLGEEMTEEYPTEVDDIEVVGW